MSGIEKEKYLKFLTIFKSKVLAKAIFLILVVPVLSFSELPKNEYIIENNKIYYQSDFEKLRDPSGSVHPRRLIYLVVHSLKGS